MVRNSPLLRRTRRADELGGDSVTNRPPWYVLCVQSSGGPVPEMGVGNGFFRSTRRTRGASGSEGASPTLGAGNRMRPERTSEQ